VFGEERVSEVSIETGAVWDGQSFESDAEGVRKECGSRNLLFFQDRVEAKGKRGCSDEFDSGE